MTSNNPNVPSPPGSPILPNTPPTSPQRSHKKGGSSIQGFFDTALEATNPPLRHLASHSTLNSIHSNGTSRNSLSDVYSTRTKRSQFRPMSTNFEEQRHEGKPNLSITRNTKRFDPEYKGRISVLSGKGCGMDVSSVVSRNLGTDEMTLFGLSRSSGLRAEEAGSLGSLRGKGLDELDESIDVEKMKKIEAAPPLEKDKNKVEEDDNVYPGPLGLIFLSIGLMLCVFLISLDRTIITTAIPYITNEFSSYADIGWYGSAYLLTAGAFQPMYGRIFMLFDIKWSYLTALAMFELGSLICGVAPNSVCLIVGRAIAGLGSAGILTGSFVVVSHAVPLAKRPILTAVVGLMFGVGATAGPLLGGVFTDLVSWRWCFYFNLPVGAATAIALLLFFSPPKKHALMGKSVSYRVFELDLVGNIIILGASIQLFLALSYTEQHVSWSSPLIVGLLLGAFATFVVFCGWMWWKADGALIPPRIIGQRSVAASCAVAFFLYSATLIHMFYLPFWFQAVQNASAIHSGVNMIPYVIANALFTLLAGIFVSKNGYFTIPAIVGCAIGCVGCGLISMLDVDSGTKWIGYEICASAGIGMAIQQGFTAVQIVLPLDEVAIGTAAVVAFQSLGGSIFVSVGNTILQNTLLSAGRNNMLPGVDVQAVIDAGASSFRDIVPASELPALLGVYNDALRKVFIAAAPMAGLAVLSCLFLEWRNVKDTKRSSEESKLKEKEKRSETERAILESYRKSHVSTSSGGGAWSASRSESMV